MPHILVGTNFFPKKKLDILPLATWRKSKSIYASMQHVVYMKEYKADNGNS